LKDSDGGIITRSAESGILKTWGKTESLTGGLSKQIPMLHIPAAVEPCHETEAEVNGRTPCQSGAVLQRSKTMTSV
jgi:hypothetical protein